MSDCPCDPCNRPRHPNYTICSHHAWLVERALAETPALARELDLTITRQTSTGARTGSRSTGRPLPLDLAASEAMAVLRNTLTGWVREIAPEPHQQPADNLNAIGRWLHNHHHDLVVHHAADQAVDEILAATRNAWKTTDRKILARVQLPDPCPDCGARLQAALHDVGDPRPNLVWCDGVEPHRWEPVQWLRLGHRLGYGREVG